MRMSLTDLTRIRMVNATMICLTSLSLRIVPGSMYVKDFLRELDKLNIEIGQEELDEINRISDSTGKVFPPPHKIEYLIQNGKGISSPA